MMGMVNHKPRPLQLLSSFIEKFNVILTELKSTKTSRVFAVQKVAFRFAEKYVDDPLLLHHVLFFENL